MQMKNYVDFLFVCYTEDVTAITNGIWKLSHDN